MQGGRLLPLFQAAIDLYSKICRPICEKYEISQPSFDIIMFLASNPDRCIAKDITRMRGLKPNLVSMYVDKLVHDGFLTREEVSGDRRKIKLVCTSKTKTVINEGRRAQEVFFKIIEKGMSDSEIGVLEKCIAQIEENINNAKEQLF